MVISMDRWFGKVAVVTGASSGIGAAIADQLVDNGLIVAGIDIHPDTTKERSGKKGKLFFVKADVSKEEEMLEAFEWVTVNLGPVRILINSAGVAIRAKNLTEGTDTEIWKTVLGVNVLGLCIATREAVKIMNANNADGHIVHINSISGHRVFGANLNIYSASKHAVTALSETLRQELAQRESKIKVTSISPGYVETRLTTLNTDLTPEIRTFWENKPLLKSENVADAVIYALSTPGHVQISEIIIKPMGGQSGHSDRSQFWNRWLVWFELIEKRAQKLSDQKGKLYAVKANLIKEEDILKSFEWVTDNLGPVHILINNTGVANLGTNLTEGSTEILKKILDLNVLGLCIFTREAFKIMKASNINGHIIHINSVLGHRYAVTALTETLRHELNHLNSKIKISSVNLGLVEMELTTMNEYLTPERRTRFEKIPILKSEDVADAVVYVLSIPEHVQMHELTVVPTGEEM
ncbi:adh short, NAD binding 10 and/or KR domain containing protein [Asbolus verrucosus]|uniref:Adh short, NAD binding 10 and/or KR domain containing protein n=1 Tax=Asbolus verrucosus TaxID=1661398 RepID=A0A482W7A5_ASBVE|nr:adh short, NAD binding 10 and/or KR domain containing protein [Asbolus verrucosus]